MRKIKTSRRPSCSRPKGEARELILQSVCRVIARDGLANTTVEAIAVEAGMSKGGVLHHFPSKRALLRGHIDNYERSFRARQAAKQATLPPGRYCALKATVLVMLEEMEETLDEVANMARILDDPELCAMVGDMKRRTFAQATRDIDNPGAAALVFYIMDGIWMDCRFSPMVIPRETKVTAIEKLIDYIDSLEVQSQRDVP